MPLGQMDVDEDRQGYVIQFKLRAVPTVIFFRGGEEEHRWEGGEVGLALAVMDRGEL